MNLTAIIATSALSLLLTISCAAISSADSVDPDYGGTVCSKQKGDIRACCDDMLEGVKNEVKECIKIATEKRKQLKDAKTAKAAVKKNNPDNAETLAAPSVSPVNPVKKAEDTPSRSVAPDTGGVEITWDFETGDLRGWDAAGNAFKTQPTYGDNPTERKRGQASKHQGNYWIGTFEKRPTPDDKPGETQGDEPKGTLTSKPFTINSKSINFLIGGGCDLKDVRVELLVDGNVVNKVTGDCHESMKRKSFDVTKYKGKSAQIRLVDDSRSGWGHINFDDVRFEL
jgi:hypothetical protein